MYPLHIQQDQRGLPWQQRLVHDYMQVGWTYLTPYLRRINWCLPFDGISTSTQSSWLQSVHCASTEPSPTVVPPTVFTAEDSSREPVVLPVRRAGWGCTNNWRGVCPNSFTCSSMAATSYGSWTLVECAGVGGQRVRLLTSEYERHSPVHVRLSLIGKIMEYWTRKNSLESIRV